MNIWLVKTEPEVYSIDDLKRDRTTCWNNIRNYQARNFLQQMLRGETVLIYHSNAEPTAIVGLATVAKTAYPDPSQFDPDSEYFDPKATPEKPRWFSPDLRFVKKLSTPLTLAELKADTRLAGMALLQRGSRLSVQLVSEKEFKILESKFS